MPRGRKHGAEEIIPKLREAEVVISQGGTNEFAAKQIGVSAQTFLRWRKEYGGLRMDQAKRLKELEKENGRLKRLLADAELDKAILKEAASGNF
jgi:transposase-like protein